MVNKNKQELINNKKKLEKVSKDIETLINIAIRSKLATDSIKERLSDLEKQKICLEIEIESLSSDLMLEECEVLLDRAIADSRHYFKYHNVEKARLVIGEYIDKVVVDNKSVKIYFKISIPDDNMELKPLVITGNREDIYKMYRPAI